MSDGGVELAGVGFVCAAAGTVASLRPNANPRPKEGLRMPGQLVGNFAAGAPARKPGRKTMEKFGQLRGICPFDQAAQGLHDPVRADLLLRDGLAREKPASPGGDL